MSTTRIHELIKRWKKEGRGQGHGKDYKPWYTAKQIPSHGKTHRPRGIKTGREHLLLSDWEYFYFLLVDWTTLVADIREQFPLLDIDETVEIATELGVEHPIEPNTGLLKVITTDFFLDFHDNSELAVSFKPYKKITEREIEKMEIERVYWQRRGIAWELITDKDVPVVYAKNIDYVHSTFNLDDYGITEGMIKRARILMDSKISKRNLGLSDITEEVDDRLGLNPGTTLTIARHLIITKKWVVNMNNPINVNEPLDIIHIAASDYSGGQKRYAN